MIPGMSPKQMKNIQRQMKKMGMDMKEIEGVQEVIIRCDDKDLIISPADISWGIPVLDLLKNEKKPSLLAFMRLGLPAACLYFLFCE